MLETSIQTAFVWMQIAYRIEALPNDQGHPIVFVSYSHDSDEHRQWVRTLAERLLHNGVDVKLDQWDIGPGDDLTKYMEQSVRNVDRVLVICTETYVRKADDGIGGVGYETMIVSGELVADLGSAKFVPILRQDPGHQLRPASLSTRVFVDLSTDDQFEANFDHLLRELHGARIAEKPQIGKNPFLAEPKAVTAGPAASAVGEESPAEPEEFLSRGAEVVAREDFPSWRTLIRQAQDVARPTLDDWWAEFGGISPKNQDDLIEQTLEGLLAFQPLVAVALAAVASGKDRFKNQIALFEQIVVPEGWNRGGLVVRVELPKAGGFLYQGIHGALCLHVSELNNSIRLAREEVKLPSWQDHLPIYQVPDFVGWPDALGNLCTSTLR